MSGRELSVAEVEARLRAGDAVLVDVREAGEFAASRIAGAVNLPLSAFDPAALPAGPVVLYCGIGRRSAMALAQCGAGVAHMAGGLAAWQAAGLAVEG